MTRFPFFSRSRFVLSLALCALWGLAAPAAHAQEDQPDDPVARARIYFEAAMAYFDEGEYEAAIPQFERALELTTAPEILYNLYIAHERVAQFDKAAVYLRTYISVADDAENREQMLSRLEALERRADRSSEPEEAPLDEPAPARELPEDAQPRTEADEPPPAETGHTDERSMVGPIVSYLVAGAGVIAMAVGGTLALTRDSDLANDCGADAGRRCTDDDVAPLRRASITADVGLGVAIAGALVGTLLILLGRSSSSDAEANVELAPAVGRSEGGLVLHGRF